MLDPPRQSASPLDVRTLLLTLTWSNPPGTPGINVALVVFGLLLVAIAMMVVVAPMTATTTVTVTTTAAARGDNGE